MNAKKAESLGLTKDVTKFEPNTWLRAYWGNGDRDHQYSTFLTAERIKGLTEFPNIGTYYRLATKDEAKAGEIREAIVVLEEAADEFRLHGKIDQKRIAKAHKIITLLI